MKHKEKNTHANTNATLQVKGPLAIAAVLEQHDQQ